MKENLSGQEQDMAVKFNSPMSRNHFIIGRSMLRILLAYYTDKVPSSLPIEYGKYGKPYLAFNEAPFIRFNVSHSEDYVLLAVGVDSEVGIDIEKIRRMPETEAILTRFFSTRTRREFGKLYSSEDKEDFFFRIWVQNEACKKALGTGLDQGEFEEPLQTRKENGINVFHFRVSVEYSAAIAIQYYDQLPLLFDLLPNWSKFEVHSGQNFCEFVKDLA